MIGKIIFVVSAVLALYMATHSRYSMSYAMLTYQDSSWTEIMHARKRNQRNKAQKRRRRH